MKGKHKIRKALTRGDSRASEIYFACFDVQTRAAIGVMGLSLLFGLGVRFSVGRDGSLLGFMFSIVAVLIFFIVGCTVAFWLIGYVLSLGDDEYRRRDRQGRYNADRHYAEKMARHVESAIPHYNKGKLMGYVINGQLFTVEQIAYQIRQFGRVGGFYPSKNGLNEVEK